MKTMRKRVLALLMALVLMFSCTAFASAAEAAPAGFDFAPVASSAGSDDGIMPLAEANGIMPLVNSLSVPYSNSEVYSGVSDYYTPIKGSFYLDEPYATLVISTQGPVTINVTIRGLTVCSRQIRNANGQFTIYDDEDDIRKLPAGYYSFEIRFFTSGVPYAFQFVGTNNVYR